jgi:hypothetical protein
LIYRYGALANDLNTRFELRLSVVLSYLTVASLAAAIVWPRAGLAAAAAIAILVTINWRYYAWFAKRRGLWFSLRVVPAHVLYHLCNGVSFAMGTIAHLGARMGIRVPGALPVTDWT